MASSYLFFSAFFRRKPGHEKRASSREDALFFVSGPVGSVMGYQQGAYPAMCPP
jgi:hypothetical protein